MTSVSARLSHFVVFISLDKSRCEEDGKEDSPPRRMAGLPKIGMGIGGNILAEMKMMQEKRTSFLPKVDSIVY